MKPQYPPVSLERFYPGSTDSVKELLFTRELQEIETRK